MKLRYKILNGILVLLGIAIVALAVVVSHTEECAPSPVLAADTDRFKAIMYRCYGSPDVLQLEDVPKPVPADNEVLIKVHAAAVNPLDWHYMRGSPYFMRLMSGIGAPKDETMGVDFSGTVEAVGTTVSRFKPGDAVFGARGGAFGEYVLMPEDRAVVPKPDNVSFEEAAAVPIAGITALQALRDKGQLQPGQRVLINGASGGVGTYAVQIAKALGAEVDGVCSTRNVEMVSSIGADRVFDYKKEDYTESGETYDLIVDMVGNHSILANRGLLKPGGIYVLVGGPKGDWIAPLIKPIGAMIISPFVDESIISLLAQVTQDDMDYLAKLMAAGKMRSVIDRRFSLSEVPEAIAYSESGRARGKIIVNITAGTDD